ncbi:MAG TPA: hypothetical protein VFF26_11280 [Gallionella sp.]|nr:hypothetical protein [Gallionella sp.]
MPSDMAGIFSLQSLAMLNEDIKAVVELSRGIGLGAINAGLISNKCNSGSGSRGFGIAAEELRQFSRKQEEVMHMMEEAVFREIAAAAALQKLVRRRNGLAAAERESESGSAALSARIARVDEAIRQGRLEQDEWRRSLLALLRRSEQSAKGGHVTARVARMEAVSGGGQAATMTMAAAGIEEQVLQAMDIVRRLISQVKGGR